MINTEQKGRKTFKQSNKILTLNESNIALIWGKLW